jgi:hypothetical protein
MVSKFKPILERKTVVDRVIDKVLKFIDTYINGLPEGEVN